MNIGEAAKQSAVSAKMIRHYEELELLPEVPRTESGYRQYDATTVHTLPHLAHGCPGDERPDCPILDDLAGGRAA